MPKLCPIWLHKETTFRNKQPYKTLKHKFISPCYAYQDVMGFSLKTFFLSIKAIYSLDTEC